MLKGNKLRVELSAPKPVKIFVGGLSHETSNFELRDLFEQQGVKILECDIIKKKDKDHYGFVHIDCSEGFQVAEKVIAALNKTKFNGSIITVAISEPRDEQWGGGMVRGRGARGGYPGLPGRGGGMFHPGGPGGGVRPGMLDGPGPFPPPGGLRGHPGMRGVYPGLARGGPGAGPFSRGGGPGMRPMGPATGYFTAEYGQNMSTEGEETQGTEHSTSDEGYDSLLVRMGQELAALVQKDFAEKLWACQRREEYCDMMIICHGRKFACHRVILATKARNTGYTKINKIQRSGTVGFHKGIGFDKTHPLTKYLIFLKKNVPMPEPHPNENFLSLQFRS
jgi:RNA recognition motif. (a.k.a. RRM, RBD, or RNP domain)